MNFNVHGGHNPDGMKGCGAVGLVKESTEVRKIKDEVIRLLRFNGHTVYDCTCNDGTDAQDVLRKIVAKCNEHTVDYDISIHLNACVKDYQGDGKTTGTLCYVYSMKDKNGNESKSCTVARRITNEISALGYRNQGVKSRNGLYVLRHTNAPAILVECFFCDDKDDVALYDVKKIAQAIVKGLLNQSDINTKPLPEPTPVIKPEPNPQPAPQKLPDLSGYTGHSIVDALNKVGYNSSFSARTELWKQIGQTDKYKGTAEQNTFLLKKLQGKFTTPAATKPEAAPTSNIPSLKGYKGVSIVDGLKKFGYASDFNSRAKYWSAIGKTSKYKGTALQNIQLLNTLKGV